MNQSALQRWPLTCANRFLNGLWDLLSPPGIRKKERRRSVLFNNKTDINPGWSQMLMALSCPLKFYHFSQSSHESYIQTCSKSYMSNHVLSNTRRYFLFIHPQHLWCELLISTSWFLTKHDKHTPTHSDLWPLTPPPSGRTLWTQRGRRRGLDVWSS